MFVASPSKWTFGIGSRAKGLVEMSLMSFWSLPLSQTSSIRRQRQHEAAIFIFSEPCMFPHEYHCL